VIILSAHSDDAYVQQAVLLGATGFLQKQTSSDNLGRAIREVHQGNTFFSDSISKRLRGSDQAPSDRGGRSKKTSNHLSSRETEVLQLIVEAMPNKQVAAELGLSFKTVDKHRQHIMAKLDIHDVSGLTRYAIGAGIIESSVQVTIV
jgi:DNA-binding NarL/FixJ family response regulator